MTSLTQRLYPHVLRLERIELKLYRLGVMLCLALVLGSCRKDHAPIIELCQLDGFGGADCMQRDGNVIYKAPEALKNYLATNSDDQAAFTAWCFQTSVEEVKRHGFKAH